MQGMQGGGCYKYCIVPLCKNTTKTAPEKVYFHMPRGANIRKKWCKAMGRKYGSDKSPYYCCEEHFNIEKDAENYMEYKIMALQQGQNTRLRLKRDIVPHKFQCQKKGSEPVPGDEAEMEEEEPKVCRTCLASGVRMFDVAAVGLQYTFGHVTRTKLYTSDERPTQVCFVCCSQLQRFRAFCQMSRKAETYMTKLVKKGLQITQQAVSKRHRLIKKPKLDVTKNPLITIHTLEDSNECDSVEVKVEVVKEEQDDNVSDTETESEIEIVSEVKTETNISERDPQRENETEEWLLEDESEREIKIEIDDIDIKELDPFDSVEHTTVRDEVYYSLQCTEAFPSQSELLEQNHTQKKFKQANSTKPIVNAKITKRNVKTKLEAQCQFCNMTFAIKTQLVTHEATEHEFGELSEALKPKRRKPNILKKTNIQ